MKNIFLIIALVTPFLSAGDTSRSWKKAHMADPKYLPGVWKLSTQQAEARTKINLSYIAPRGIVTTHTTRNVNLHHGEQGFSVHEGDTVCPLEAHDMDRMAREINRSNLLEFLNAGGRLHITRATDGSFLLRTSIGAQGGGPITGQVCYWTTKFVGVVGGICAASYLTKKTVDTMNNIATEVAPRLMEPGTQSEHVIKQGIETLAGSITLGGIPKNVSDIAKGGVAAKGLGILNMMLTEQQKFEIGQSVAPGVLLLKHAGKYAHLTQQVTQHAARQASKQGLRKIIPIVYVDITKHATWYLDAVETVAQGAKVIGDSAPGCTIL